MQQHFRPEFINRLDEIVVFHPLGREHIRAHRATSRSRIWRSGWPIATSSWTISEAALDLLGEAGFDPVYGARPLKRAIQHQLENPLAQRILSGEFGPGDTIVVDTEGGRLEFHGVKAQAA